MALSPLPVLQYCELSLHEMELEDAFMDLWSLYSAAAQACQ